MDANQHHIGADPQHITNLGCCSDLDQALAVALPPVALLGCHKRHLSKLVSKDSAHSEQGTAMAYSSTAHKGYQFQVTGEHFSGDIDMPALAGSSWAGSTSRTGCMQACLLSRQTIPAHCMPAASRPSVCRAECFQHIEQECGIRNMLRLLQPT